MKKMKSLMIVGLFLSIWLAGCNYEHYPGENKFLAVRKKLMPSVIDLTRIPPNAEFTNEPYIKGKIAVFKQYGVSQVIGGKSNKDTNHKYDLDNLCQGFPIKN